jgi:hypothetical protein
MMFSPLGTRNMTEEEGKPDDETLDSQSYDEPIAQIPATFVDTFTINWWGGNLRITFGEFLSGKKYYRNAIVMPFSDAEVLANYILDIVQKDQTSTKTE